MFQSGEASPGCGPGSASVLVTDRIFVTGAGSPLSLTVADTVTGTIVPFDGRSTAGLTLSALMTGAVVSVTVTVTKLSLKSPSESVTRSRSVCTPTGSEIVGWAPVASGVGLGSSNH